MRTRTPRSAAWNTFFSSNRPGGYGDADIYVAEREGGVWQKPRNLGATINSAAKDTGPMLSYDGRYLFFTSTRGGSEDIYWISAAVLEGHLF